MSLVIVNESGAVLLLLLFALPIAATGFIAGVVGGALAQPRLVVRAFQDSIRNG